MFRLAFISQSRNIPGVHFALVPALYVLFAGYPGTASAVCPVCTVAVGTGVGLTRWLGVDDVITGLWLGGLIVSMIYWTLNFLEKRHVSLPAQSLITAVFYFLLALAPLYLSGIIGNPANRLYGIDKLVLGTAAGSMAFFCSAYGYERLKKQHGGHAYFPFQKVVMPVLTLITLSLIAYFLT